MWPTELTLLLLLAGLLPVCYVVALAIRRGLQEFTSLRFAVIAFLWFGYHLSPWLAFRSSRPWAPFLLVPGYIDTALLFSTLSMAAFLLGYQMILAHQAVSLARLRPQLRLPRVKPELLFFLGLLSVGAFLLAAGGLQEAWSSHLSRGFGQFTPRDLMGKSRQALSVVGGAAWTLLATSACLYILEKPAAPSRWLLGGTYLLIASFRFMQGFSRGAGLGFVVLAWLVLRLRGKRYIWICVVALLLGAWLSFVAWTLRGDYRPGLWNFFRASTAELETPQRRPVVFSSPDGNPADSVPAWTRKAYAATFEKPRQIETAFRFFWNLNPLPSEFVPLLPIGQDLAVLMGTWGYGGITTPALAELYYVFGYPGSAFMALLGAVFAWAENLNRKRCDLTSFICVVLCLTSLPIALHSTCRAMTRPIVYGIVLVGLLGSPLRSPSKCPQQTPTARPLP